MDVTVYSTSTCPYCQLTKDFLKEKGVSFEEVNLETDSKAMEEIAKLTGQMGAPVVKIDDHVIVGWNKQLLEQALEGKKKADWNPGITPNTCPTDGSCEACQ